MAEARSIDWIGLGTAYRSSHTIRKTTKELANERTLLAWIRTGVTLIGLGFVVARFSRYLLRTLAAEAHSPPVPNRVAALRSAS